MIDFVMSAILLALFYCNRRMTYTISLLLLLFLINVAQQQGHTNINIDMLTCKERLLSVKFSHQNNLMKDERSPY